jgi:hypothetical protein
MVKKSKRLNSLLKRNKSVIKKPSIRRKPKRNIRFIKRGGEINIQEVAEKLNEITEIREQQGDLPHNESHEKTHLTEDELSKLNPSQLIAHLREMRKDKKPENLWVEMGVKVMERTISNYTDDIIMILLDDYDFNSVKMIFMNNLFDIKPSMIQQYLPSNMWSKFGGVSQFTDWITKMVDPILSKGLEESTTQKLPLTKDAISNIMTRLKDKYPGINGNDAGIRDLILKDLFKKIYYLQNDGSCIEKLQPGGRPFSMAQKKKAIIVAAGVCFIYGSLLIGTAALVVVYIAKTPVNEDKDFLYKDSDLEFLRKSDIMMLTRGIKPVGSFFREAERSWEGKLPKSEKNRRVADEKSYQDAYIDYKIAQYESKEAVQRNKMEELEQQAAKDVALMLQGIRPTSDLFKEAQLEKLKKKPINGLERQIANSDAYKSEFDAFQAKKTSDNVFNRMFSGFSS